jgi:hypothetical protein
VSKKDITTTGYNRIEGSTWFAAVALFER